MGIGFAGIQKTIDLRIDLIDIRLGHKLTGHAQRVANSKGFQYTFENSQTISLISIGSNLSKTEKFQKLTNWHRLRGASCVGIS